MLSVVKKSDELEKFYCCLKKLWLDVKWKEIKQNNPLAPRQSASSHLINLFF